VTPEAAEALVAALEWMSQGIGLAISETSSTEYSESITRDIDKKIEAFRALLLKT
jgi:hypothetical protein